MVKKNSLYGAISQLKKAFCDDPEVCLFLEKISAKIDDLTDQNIGKNTLADFELPKELANKKNAVVIFCDGACRGNPGPGAWSVLAQNMKGVILFESAGIDLHTTNNKMELTAALEGMRAAWNFIEQEGLVDFDLYVYSDSKYLIEGMSKWIIDWKRRGWKKADGKTPDNLELWQELEVLRDKFHDVEFSWVKGHSGHPQNEYCDRMANEALDQAGL